MAILIRVLGAAAGGGLPQWNCAGGESAAVWRGLREGAPSAPPSSQSSVAISGDGRRWSLLNASPDLRAQILATPALHPVAAEEAAPRRSPIKEVVLTDGDVDHVAGLLTLREKTPFRLIATRGLHATLARNPIFNALDPALVPRVDAALDAPFALESGLEARLFSTPGKIPLYEEGGAAPETDLETDGTVAVEATDGARRVVYAPCCARVTDAFKARVAGADALFFDGTLYHDDELVVSGLGAKTGRRMGHISISGEDGAMAALRDVAVGRKIFIHINNSNPVWRAESAEARQVRAAGWEIAFDGMELSL